MSFRLITASDSSVIAAPIAGVVTTEGPAVDGYRGVQVHESDRSVLDVLSLFPPDKIASFHAFAQSGNVYDRLVKSFAPSIWELTDVKRGALCMLFGGNLSETKEKLQKRNSQRDEVGAPDDDDENYTRGESAPDDAQQGRKTSKVHQRSEINILLCGDPGKAN